MDVIVQPLADLFKYYVQTQYLNYDDQKLNLLLYTVIGGLVTFVLRFCTHDNVVWLWRMYKWWLKFHVLKEKQLILAVDRANWQYFVTYPVLDKVNSERIARVGINISDKYDGQLFMDSYLRLLHTQTNCVQPFHREPAQVHFHRFVNENALIDQLLDGSEFIISQFETFRDIEKKYGMVPLVYKDGYYIYMKKYTWSSGVDLLCTNQVKLNEFVAYVLDAAKKFDVSSTEKYGNVYEANESGVLTRHGHVKKQLTFDNYVSRHKPYIVDRLAAFKEQRLFRNNPYVSNNIGLLLYGGYGTGKTYLVSAVAQYLERDIIMVNLARLRTKSAFRALFSRDNIQKYVYCFDEFDYVLASFFDKDIKAEMQNEKNAQMQMLMAQLQNVKDNRDLAENLTQQIKGLMEVNSSDVLTYEFMLSEISGLQDVSGRVIIATTNFLNKIPSAMLRAGRLDTVLCFDCFNRQEIAELVTRMYSPCTSAEERRIQHATSCFKEDRFTPAEIIQKKCEFEDLEKLLAWLCVDVDVKND
jgi:hypothetical protein